MKASELRIGNLINGIYYDYDIENDDSTDYSEEIENEIVCTVSTLDSADVCEYRIYVESDLDIETFSDFKPIPLTEEWLLKLGFKKNEENGYFEFDRFIVAYNDLVDSFYLCDIDVFVKIETVHHLQNLYFAIRNKELTLKP